MAAVLLIKTDHENKMNELQQIYWLWSSRKGEGTK